MFLKINQSNMGEESSHWQHYTNIKQHYPNTKHDHIICDGCETNESNSFYGVPGYNVDLCWICFEEYTDDDRKKSLRQGASKIHPKHFK
jgi:hypothetical protein